MTKILPIQLFWLDSASPYYSNISEYYSLLAAAGITGLSSSNYEVAGNQTLTIGGTGFNQIQPSGNSGFTAHNYKDVISQYTSNAIFLASSIKSSGNVTITLTNNTNVPILLWSTNSRSLTVQPGTTGSLTSNNYDSSDDSSGSMYVYYVPNKVTTGIKTYAYSVN